MPIRETSGTTTLNAGTHASQEMAQDFYVSRKDASLSLRDRAIPHVPATKLSGRIGGVISKINTV